MKHLLHALCGLLCLLCSAASVQAQADSSAVRRDSLPPPTPVDSASTSKKGSKMGGGGGGKGISPRPAPTDSSKVAKIDTLAPAPIDIKKERKPRAHSPRRAVMWALIVPGGGQIYNRRYWKLPIVYAGLGGLGFWYVRSRIEYRCYRNAYISAADSDPNTNDICERDPFASARTLQLQSQLYRTQSEYALLGFLAFYALCATDAFVDAHLMSFDVGDDLSLHLRPSPTSLGLYLQPSAQNKEIRVVF